MTVAICTRNRANFLQQAIRSAAEQARNGTEILVVDNASTDATPEVAAKLAAHFPCVKVVREAELGLSAARNTALRQGKGTFVIFLDDDAIALPGWLESYEQFFRAPPSPRIAGAGGTVIPRYEAPLPAWMPANTGALDLGESAHAFTDQGSPYGCNIAFARELSLEAGGFRTDLGRKGNSLASHEESDLCERLKKAGYEVWWVPRAPIEHCIAAERFTVRFQIRSEFAQGRTSALSRLALRTAGSRLFFRLGRIVVAPFHFLLCALGGLLLLPIKRARVSMRLFLRAARIAGFAFQLACSAK